MRQPKLSDADHAQIREAVARLIEARLGDLGDLAALRAELIAVKRERDELRAERDQWRHQALLVSDRYAEAREDIRTTSALTGRMAREVPE